MNKNVVIIGGGIVGCLSALEFKKKGFEVAIIERLTIGKESSSAAAGILYPLLPWKYDEEIFELCKFAPDFFKELSKTLLDEVNVDVELMNSGLLILKPSDENEINKWSQRNNNLCIKKNNSFLIPNVLQINPEKLMISLKKYLKVKGIELIENSEVINLNANKDNIKSVQTKNNKKYYADFFVLSAGAWSSIIHPKITKKIKPIRGQIIQYDVCNFNISNIYYSNDMYVFQRKDRSIIAGSTLDDVGFSEENIDLNIIKLDRKAKTIIPMLKESKIKKSWYGFRPGVDDNKPIISPDSYFKNMYIHSGHFRYGITMAPATTMKLMTFFN